MIQTSCAPRFDREESYDQFHFQEKNWIYLYAMSVLRFAAIEVARYGRVEALESSSEFLEGPKWNRIPYSTHQRKRQFGKKNSRDFVILLYSIVDTKFHPGNLSSSVGPGNLSSSVGWLPELPPYF